MAVIPPDYLPPKEYLPETIQLLPELNYPEKLNLADVLLDTNVQQRGDKVAIYYGDQRITYKDLQRQVNRFSNALRELGVEQNDRVVLRAPNIPEYIIWQFACWRIGAIPVLVNHYNRAEEVAFKLNDTEAVAACVQSESYEQLGLARKECPFLKHVIVCGEPQPDTLDYASLIATQSEVAESAPTSRDDFARIIYSSGTTGMPKGILTTLGGVLSAADTHGRYILKLRDSDVVGGHPFFTFALGSVNFTWEPWRFGASLSIVTQFKPEDQLRLIEEHGITVLVGVPTSLRMMLSVEDAKSRFDLSSLRVAQTAGEWLPAGTIREWLDRFGIFIIDSLGSGDLNYWLSTFEGMDESKFGSTGLSVPGFENIVVNDEYTEEVPPGTLGNLLVRGPVGQMYWRRPDKQIEGVAPLDSPYRGWNRPGLLFTKDADGYFWYSSRSDDLIVTSGYKVPGGEVEAALNNHPAVLESAVVESPDRERGNVIKAFVVLRPGYEPSDALRKELQDFVKKQIEPYKYPRILEFASADSLPRTSTGKIIRRALRDEERKKAEQVQA